MLFQIAKRIKLFGNMSKVFKKKYTIISNIENLNNFDIANTCTFNMHITNIADGIVDNKLCKKDEGASFDLLNKFVKSELQRG